MGFKQIDVARGNQSSEKLNLPPTALIDASSQSITRSCSSGTITDHPSDCRLRARVGLFSPLVACIGTIGALHQSWIEIVPSPGGSWHTHTTSGFLQNYGQDKAMVNTSGSGDLLDSWFD
jgi:hypothetical protein